MKKDSSIGSESTDVITLSALLHEVLTEERREASRTPKVGPWPDDASVCRAVQAPAPGDGTMRPSAVLRLKRLADADHEAVA